MWKFYFNLLVKPFWKEYILTGAIGSIVSGLVVFEQRGVVTIFQTTNLYLISLFILTTSLNATRTGLFTYIRHRSYTQLYSYFFKNICLKKLEYWDLYYDKLELIQCCTHDIATFVDTTIQIYSIIIRNLISSILLFYFLYNLKWEYIIFAIGICLCRSIFLEYFVRMWEKQNDILKAIGDRIKKDLVEYITNNTSMQIYGLADTYDQVLHQHLSNYNNNQIQDSILYGIFMFMFLFIMRSIDIGVYLLNNDMNSNSFFEIQITVNYFRLLSESIQSLSDIQKELKRNKSSISRLLKYMNTDHNAKMDTCNNNNINSGFKIEIKNLTFGYPTRLDLIYDNYSVTIDEGSIFYLKGDSGTGKTTLIKLILGLYRPNEGEILIGNKSTYFMSNYEIRQLITIIPQEPVIFENKTLRENLDLFSRKTKTKKLKKILKVVKLSNLISLLDKQLVQLSGGQKQRLSIARVLLNKKVPIVILDEAFSAMDPQLRKSMQKLVYNYIKRHGKTLIVVQHE